MVGFCTGWFCNFADCICYHQFAGNKNGDDESGEEFEDGVELIRIRLIRLIKEVGIAKLSWEIG